jgi:hypothetical protein
MTIGIATVLHLRGSHGVKNKLPDLPNMKILVSAGSIQSPFLPEKSFGIEINSLAGNNERTREIL